MGFRVKMFQTSAEQAAGALSQPSPLPPESLLFFPRIEPGQTVHGRGMREPLNVYFLDDNFKEIHRGRLDPGTTAIVPWGTRHVVELSTKATPPSSFYFLANYV